MSWSLSQGILLRIMACSAAIPWYSGGKETVQEMETILLNATRL